MSYNWRLQAWILQPCLVGGEGGVPSVDRAHEPTDGALSPNSKEHAIRIGLEGSWGEETQEEHKKTIKRMQMFEYFGSVLLKIV